MKKRTILSFGLFLFCLVFSDLMYAQPANDNCADAEPIVLDAMVTFTTINATTDGPFHPNSPCPTSASDSIFSDIWFVHTANITGELRWSLCGSADFDSRIAVYNAGATCPLSDGDLLNCNEDGPAACVNFESELDFNVVAGETYYLRLGGFGSEEPGAQGSGSFALTQAPTGPPNDFCDNAIAITLGEDQPISNIDATTDGPTHLNDQVCFGFNDNTAQSDIWYTFTSPVTGLIEWSTCGQVDWDSRLIVYGPGVSCPVTPDDMIACSDATAGCAGFTNILNFDAVEGETYIFRVGGFFGATGTGVFDLIEIAPVEPPANDFCTSPDTAWILTPQQADDFDEIFAGTVINSTISSGLIDPSCGDGNGGKFPDVWFKFNSLGNENIEIRYIVDEPGTGVIYEVFENCAGDTLNGNSCFRYSPDDVNILIDSITGLPPVPTEFYIRVSGWLFWTPGSFWFQLVGDNTVGTDEVVFPGTVKIAPNPTNEYLGLDLDLSEPMNANIQIFNILGEIIMKEQLGHLTNGKHRLSFDVSEFPQGIYTMVITGDESKRALKFTKL